MASKRGGRRESGNPAARAASTSGAPSAAEARGAFERASTPVILFLSRLPRWLFPIVMAVLLVAGLMVGNGILGGLLLLLLVAVLAWLTALSWPLLSGPARLLRLITVAAAALVAFARFTGRL